MAAGGTPNIQQVQSKEAAIRKLPISPELANQLQYAGEQTGLRARITSGGQSYVPSVPGQKGRRVGPDGEVATGSHRHDNGGAADLELLEKGPDGKERLLDMTIPEDRAKMQQYIKNSVVAGATGVGGAEGYMGVNRLHIGGGTPSVWGAGGSSKSAQPWVVDAYNQGAQERSEGGKNKYIAWLAKREEVAEQAGKDIDNNNLSAADPKDAAKIASAAPADISQRGLGFLAKKGQDAPNNEGYGVSGYNQAREAADVAAYKAANPSADDKLTSVIKSKDFKDASAKYEQVFSRNEKKYGPDMKKWPKSELKLLTKYSNDMNNVGYSSNPSSPSNVINNAASKIASNNAYKPPPNSYAAPPDSTPSGSGSSSGSGGNSGGGGDYSSGSSGSGSASPASSTGSPTSGGFSSYSGASSSSSSSSAGSSGDSGSGFASSAKAASDANPNARAMVKTGSKSAPAPSYAAGSASQDSSASQRVAKKDFGSSSSNSANSGGSSSVSDAKKAASDSSSSKSSTPSNTNSSPADSNYSQSARHEVPMSHSSFGMVVLNSQHLSA